MNETLSEWKSWIRWPFGWRVSLHFAFSKRQGDVANPY